MSVWVTKMRLEFSFGLWQREVTEKGSKTLFSYTFHSKDVIQVFRLLLNELSQDDEGLFITFTF